MSRVVMDSDDEGDLDIGGQHQGPVTETELLNHSDTEHDNIAYHCETNSTETPGESLSEFHVPDPNQPSSQRASKSRKTNSQVTDIDDIIVISTDGPEECPSRPLVENQESSPHDTVMDPSSHQQPPDATSNLDFSGIERKPIETKDSKDDSEKQHDQFKPSVSPLSEAAVDSIPRESIPDQVENVHQYPSEQSSKRAEKPVVLVPSKCTETESEPSMTVPKTRKRKAKAEAQQNDSISDELIGLPKEMSAPRQSRSRAAHGTPEPATIDSPKARTSKRLKTADNNEQPIDKQKLSEMGFSDAQAESALTESGGDFDKALELLVQSKSYEAVPMAAAKSDTPSRKSKRGRGRPKKSSLANDDTETRESHKKQDKDDSQDKTIEDGGAAERAKVGNPTTEVEPVPAEEDTIVVQEPSQEHQVDESPADVALPREALKDIDANAEARHSHRSEKSLEKDYEPSGAYSDGKIHHENSEQTYVTVGTASSSLNGETRASASTKLSSPAGTKKSHSPVKPNGVPLKVGLSKRARIEPLLKIVRK